MEKCKVCYHTNDKRAKKCGNCSEPFTLGGKIWKYSVVSGRILALALLVTIVVDILECDKADINIDLIDYSEGMSFLVSNKGNRSGIFYNIKLELFDKEGELELADDSDMMIYN